MQPSLEAPPTMLMARVRTPCHETRGGEDEDDEEDEEEEEEADQGLLR